MKKPSHRYLAGTRINPPAITGKETAAGVAWGIFETLQRNGTVGQWGAGQWGGGSASPDASNAAATTAAPPPRGAVAPPPLAIWRVNSRRCASPPR